jgi:hypothetical protein
MKYFLIIIFVIFNNLFAEDFSWNSTSVISKVHETSLPNGEQHTSFKSNGGMTFSSGKYGIASCSGLRTDKKEKLIEVRTICSVDINDGNKLWTELRRDKGESTVGVGKIAVIDATGPYKELINKKCVYAFTRFNEMFFGKTKCSIKKESLDILIK